MTSPKSIQIAPSILSADFSNFALEIQAIEKAGCDWVHIDVMDGHFVPNITFGPQLCKAVRPHIKTVMDVHLMISPTDLLIGAFIDSQPDNITVHYEANPHIHRTLQIIKSSGIKAGIALNPSTPASVLTDLLDDIDLICVMTVNPGFGGQKFIVSQLKKIRELRSMIGQRNIGIQIDGGVTAETAPSVVAAGADVLVSGSGVFGKGGMFDGVQYKENIDLIRKSI